MLRIDVTILFVVLLLKGPSPSDGAHFRGGTISWAPVNPSISFPVSSVSVQITSRFFYIYNRFSCNSAADVAAANIMGDTSKNIVSTSGPSWSISPQTYCKAFSVADDWQMGQRTQTVSITTSSQVSGTYSSSAWIAGIISLTNSTAWDLPFTIDVRQRADTQKINSSPYTTSLATMNMGVNCPKNQSLAIDVYDPDNDFIRCRCKSNVCIANFLMDEANCIFYFNPTVSAYYGIEIVIEDFASENSTQALSSVPFQFLANSMADSIYCCNFTCLFFYPLVK
jgi:hypothetical protein